VKEFTLDVTDVKDLNGFWDQVNKVLCPNFSDFGRNLDAFDDILQGGFGVFDEEEHIKLHIKGAANGEKVIEKWNLIKEIIEDNDHIEVSYE
jgi:RNAse (barnase) inhibitor barstar